MHLARSACALTLHALPNDIKFIILNSTSSLEDLIALASASKSWSHVYFAWREVLLLQLTRRCVSPDLLPIALHIACLPQREIRYSSVAKTLRSINLLHGYRSENAVQQDLSGLAADTLKALLRFDGLVNSFMYDFASSSLSIIDQRDGEGRRRSIPRPPVALNSTTMVDSLSVVEYHRLKRAFYHLELSAFLCAASNRGHWDEHSWEEYRRSDKYDALNHDNPPDVLRPFLRRLRTFEIEEMMCVFQHLFERALILIFHVEDDFIQRLCDMKPHYALTPQGYRLGLGRCFFDSEGRELGQQEWAESCMADGLLAMKSMCLATTPDDRLTAIGCVNLDKFLAMSHAIEEAAQAQFDPKLHRDALRSRGNDVAADSIDQPNQYVSKFSYGYLRGNGMLQNSIYQNHSGFLRWGCAMWDRKRLESLGVDTSGRWLILSDHDCASPYREALRSKPCLEDRMEELQRTWREQGTLIEWVPQAVAGHEVPPLPPLPPFADDSDDES